MKKIVRRTLVVVIGVAILFCQVTNVIVQFRLTQRQMVANTRELFWQVGQILEENQEELETVTEEFSVQCIQKAKLFSNILRNNPGVLEDQTELRRIVELVEVDEVHVFNDEGLLYAGSEPKYYGFTFNSGEQMQFFLPMLTDKHLEMCQNITPNTAEGKLMQYAAVWGESGENIIQIGMEPTRVMEARKKNELSYIFSLLSPDDRSVLCAVDPETFQLLASTDPTLAGRMLTELGVDPQRTLTDPDGFHIRTEDGLRFWIFAESDSVLLGRGYDPGAYDHVTRSGVSLLCYLLLIGFLMLYVISKYLDRRVLQGIFDINDKLQTITAGNLTERVDVRSTPEFGALSDRINQMVVRLLDDQALMSTALEAARLPMGFYEYNRSQRRVQLLGRMEELLELEPGEEERLSDWTFLEERLAWLRRCPLEKEEDVYRVPAPEERYVRLESFVRGDYVYGVLADVTETVMEKQRIKQERDRDILTGLYSRRAFRTRAVKLLRDTDKLGRGALVVVDADNLKYINDTYGHEAGDRYLISVGGALRLGDMSHCLAARLGGDEFALMIYGCATQREVLERIEEIKRRQDERSIICGDGIEEPVAFSMGVTLFPGDGLDYDTLVQHADERMYLDKRRRKGGESKA